MKQKYNTYNLSVKPFEKQCSNKDQNYNLPLFTSFDVNFNGIKFTSLK